jgi:formylglycine-generating enzyme required for sulfatase activity/serine/threonine protein kinase
MVPPLGKSLTRFAHPSPALNPLEQGAEFGDYRIVECLANDLLGAFYRAERLSSGAGVGLFVLPRKVREDKGVLVRFESLVERLKKLDHPNLLHVHGGESIDGSLVLICEDVEGVNLDQYLSEYLRGDNPEPPPEPEAQEKASRPPFNSAASKENTTGEEEDAGHPEKNRGKPKNKEAKEERLTLDRTPVASEQPGLHFRTVKDLMEQAMAGIAEAHRHELDHMALIPRYLLRDVQGQIKIVGLGLMRMLGTDTFENLASSFIIPIEAKGRRRGMTLSQALSPELRAGKGFDRRSDIFGIAFCGYYLLTTQRPSLNRYEPPTDLVQGLPDRWDEFMARSLEPDPEKRYASAAMALQALHEINVWPEKESENPVRRQIDRIPLPNAVRERGKLVSLTVRLGLIGVVGVTVVGLFSYFLQALFMSETSVQRSLAMRAPPDRAPDFTLQITPQRAKVSFAKTNQTFVVTDGDLPLLVQPGRHRVSVEAPNHRPAYMWLDSETGARNPVNVNLEPIWGSVAIEGRPGTRVTAISLEDDQLLPLGTIPESGLMEVEGVLYAGTYAFRAELPDFRPRLFSEIELPLGETVRLAFDLEPLPAQVLITSVPSGAKVLLDDQFAGLTPLPLGDLTPGREYEFVLTLPGYRDASKTLRLAPNDNIQLSFGQLQPRTGEVAPTLLLDGREPTQAERRRLTLTLNGTAFPGDSAPIPHVPAGAYTLEVTHPDYLPYRQDIKVMDNRETAVTVDLRPRPARVELVSSTPAEIQLRVNGADVEPEDSGLYFVSPGEDQELEVRIRDHLTLRRTVSLAANEQLTWQFEPQRIPGPERGEGWLLPYLGIEFVWIDPGTTTMGSPPTEQARLPVEGPPTEVELTRGFWVGQHEVTQAEYQRVMGDNPSFFSGKPDHPVESVTYFEAREFCRRLTQTEATAGRLPEGYVYRLPTEAEWVRAVRAGTRTPFSFGDTADPDDGNFKAFYPREFAGEVASSDLYGTVSVGSYRPNPSGIFDGHGNVAEWVRDWFASRYPGGRKTDYTGPSDGNDRSVRGGSWQSSAPAARSAARDKAPPSLSSPAIGFRVVLAPEL